MNKQSAQWWKEYRQRPEVKAREAARATRYRATPRGRANRLAAVHRWLAKPENHAAKLTYMQQRGRRPEVQARRAAVKSLGPHAGHLPELVELNQMIRNFRRVTK